MKTAGRVNRKFSKFVPFPREAGFPLLPGLSGAPRVTSYVPGRAILIMISCSRRGLSFPVLPPAFLSSWAFSKSLLDASGGTWYWEHFLPLQALLFTPRHVWLRSRLLLSLVQWLFGKKSKECHRFGLFDEGEAPLWAMSFLQKQPTSWIQVLAVILE